VLDKEKITDAAWANDSLADEGHSIPDIARILGIDTDGLTYVAGQRGLRMALVASRGPAIGERLKRDAYEQVVAANEHPNS
jgi:hypothetical protein